MENKIKIGFIWPLGNVLKEQYRIGYDRIGAELQKLDLYKIKKNIRTPYKVSTSL